MTEYYQIDLARMRRIVQLNCQLMSDVSYAQRMRVVPELTSDHDDCESNISDRCDRSYDQYFQADQKSLFLAYIYSNSYSRILRRYLTSFAVNEDFFHSFFGSEENDLDQKSRVKTLRNDIAKVKDEDRGGDDVMGDRDRIASNERINAGIVNPDDEDIQMASHHLLTSGNLPDTKEEKTRENTRKSRRTQSTE